MDRHKIAAFGIAGLCVYILYSQLTSSPTTRTQEERRQTPTIERTVQHAYAPTNSNYQSNYTNSVENMGRQ